MPDPGSPFDTPQEEPREEKSPFDDLPPKNPLPEPPPFRPSAPTPPPAQERPKPAPAAAPSNRMRNLLLGIIVLSLTIAGTSLVYILMKHKNVQQKAANSDMQKLEQEY